MHISDPKFWEDAFRAILAAPQLVAPGLALSAYVAWWLRGVIEKGSKCELKARATALEERLSLAQDKEDAIRERLGHVETQLDVLNSSLARKAPVKVREKAIEVTATISEMMLISSELTKLLDARQVQGS